MAKKIRLIARLDVKDEHLVKGIQYEGLRKLGAPHDFAVRYYEAGIDELLYLDTVASLYGRNNLSGILQRTSADVFIPVTAGGGVRSVQDVRALLARRGRQGGREHRGAEAARADHGHCAGLWPPVHGAERAGKAQARRRLGGLF